MARTIAQPVHDVDVHLGVGVLVIIMRVETRSALGEEDRSVFGFDGGGSRAFANAGIVSIVLVKDDAIDAVDLRAEGELVAVIECKT